MTDEAKKIVEALRRSACRGCIHSKIGRCMHIQQGKFCGSERHEAADLIEQLSKEVEQLEREHDAAVRDLYEAIENSDGIDFCTYCKHNDDWGKCEHPCNPYSGETGWEWRGLPEPPREET